MFSTSDFARQNCFTTYNWNRKKAPITSFLVTSLSEQFESVVSITESFPFLNVFSGLSPAWGGGGSSTQAALHQHEKTTRTHPHTCHLILFKTLRISKVRIQYNPNYCIIKTRWCLFVCLSTIQSRKTYRTNFNQILHKHYL